MDPLATVSQIVTPSGPASDRLSGPVLRPEQRGGGFRLPPFPGLVERPTAPERVTVISDLHIPFHSPRRVDAVLSRIEADPPDLLLILGDVFDAYPISRWDRSRDRHKTIKHEADIGRPILERIDRIGVETILLQGNHDDRIEQLLNKHPELDGSLSFRGVYGIPERWQVYPARTLYRIGEMIYLHGDLPGHKGGVGCERRMIQELRSSCMFGHTHSTGVHYLRGSHDELLGGYAVGHLTSPEVSREYRPVNSWVSSFAEIAYRSTIPSVALRLVSEDGRIA